MRRRIINIEFDGIDFEDYPDFCDAFIEYAEWEDTGKPLNDWELEALDIADYSDELLDYIT